MTDEKTRNFAELPMTQPATSDFDQDTVSGSIFGFTSLRSLFALVFFILILRSSIVSPYHVPTPSMEPTIKVGDRLLAFKAAYELRLPFTDYTLMQFGTPKRGDIVVFKYPKDPSVDHYVKRVVGVAGDEIKIVDDVLHVNNQPVQLISAEDQRAMLWDVQEADKKLLFIERSTDSEHFVMRDKDETRHPGLQNFPARRENIVVPEGSVFVLGDNRDTSNDSRHWGEVPLSYVRGKAILVIWSMYDPGGDEWHSLRFSRFGKIL